MKRIHLLRHAKSSWKNLALADIDRPLNKRGLKTAPQMAQHIADAGCCFDQIYCSPSKRTRMTIELIMQSLHNSATERHKGLTTIKWNVDEALYCFSGRLLIDWFETLDDNLSEVLIIGHNPALTEFANTLCQCDIHNIPTCAYVQLNNQHLSSWNEIGSSIFELSVFLKPKEMI
ncbi:2,3-bisphosphoglycerate-dependent phosphoglycerate mutase [Thalassocella blandensis]|nr:2,3-bisphosphoglycerate-dependent phosphoglycerate mutase [Thalassocella blandensis]